MVESLYGRQTHPQNKHEKGLFQSPFLHHRKVSGEPLNLRTIAESEDDHELSSIADSPAPNLVAGCTGTGHVRKPRAISLPLPTVYRDGSYLRINVSDRFNHDRTRRRRFSEPAVAWNSNPYGFKSNINPKGCHIPASFSLNPRMCVTKGSTFSQERKIDVEKRRHSDPLLYATINSPGIECSSGSRQKDFDQNSNNQNELGSHIPVEYTTEENPTIEISRPDPAPVLTPTRRRKSSLVPIPFGVGKNTARRQKSSSKRRYSFPLSKSEEGQTSNLLELEKCSERQHQIGNSWVLEPCVTSLDFTPIDDNEITATMEDSSEEKKKNCEKIITQWMKFFG